MESNDRSLISEQKPDVSGPINELLVLIGRSGEEGTKMKNILCKYIIVKFEVSGFHWWEDAPDKLAFLREAHRHVFKFEVYLRVDHSNRDLEFYVAQAAMKRWVQETYRHASVAAEVNFKTRSCEQIAEELGEYCIKKGWIPQAIEVYEDGENGGGVQWAS